MTPDPHPPVLSDDDNSDDDFESASEGEQEEHENDSTLQTPAAKVLAPSQEPVQHAAVKQLSAPLQPASQPPQQQSQLQQQSEKQVPQEQKTRQQEPRSPINPNPYHNSIHSDASPRLNIMSLKDKTPAGPAVPTPHASIDTPPTHTPARVQERVLSQTRLGDTLRSTTPPNSSTPVYPKQFAPSEAPFQPPSPSFSTKPPLAPPFPGTQQQQQQQQQQTPRPQQQQQQQQQYFGSSQSHYQQQSGQRLADSSVVGRNKQQQEAGRGWGSLGSWINTAVSTVSEVIENPNVVVSKAHTIGQGIRNVATEQIDRVYESLDPVYEYERERQKQQQTTQWPPQQPITQLQHESHLDECASQLSSSNTDSSSLFPNPKKEPRKDDISDLLQSAQSSSQPSPPSARPTSDANKNGDLHSGLSRGKLAYNEDTVDAWEDDAWDDDWGDQAAIDKAEPTTEPLSAVKQSTVQTQPTLHQPLNKLQEKPAFGLQTQQHKDRQQDTFLAKSRDNQTSGDSSRNVKDLFGAPRPSSLSSDQGSRAANNLSVPQLADSVYTESPTHRKPSTDLRPAEALFSTLDFASNAIGSAVLGVHRKVTQAGHSQQQKNGSGLDFQYARSASPAWGTPQRRESTDSAKEVPEKADRSALSNPTFEAVGGNVVSTGLGALEILGKRAVDVISDVRRAGNFPHGQGGAGSSDVFDEHNSFKVPPKMNIATMFEEAGGRAHLLSLRSLAAAASTRVNAITTSRPDFLNVGQLDDLEQLLEPQALDSVLKEPTADLLAGHKDFRAMVALLEQMGVQGTTHLRQLRNCTRKLSTLVPDNVNAFEQEWHNHQTRASEKDFFARGPIKKFFESRLLTVYFDGLRALAQFTDKTCDQILRLGENFNIRVAEKSANSSAHSDDGDDASKLDTLALAKVLQQLIGSLIAETKFISRQYRQSLDAILQTAKGLTTPLDNLDWEDLAMGLDRIKGQYTDMETIEAIGFIHSGALCVLEVLRNDLLIDVAYGKLVPTARKPRSRPAVNADTKHATVSRSSSRPLLTSGTTGAGATGTTLVGRRPSTASSDQRVASPSPRMSPMMSPSPRISPMNRQSPSPSPSLKPSPGLYGGQPLRPSLSPSLQPVTIATGQAQPSPSQLVRPTQQQQQQQQQQHLQTSSQGLSSRLSPSPALRPTQAVGQQPRSPMMTARPKTPVSQPSSTGTPSRVGAASAGGAGVGAAPQNLNPHSYSLYPRPPPVQRPPVKEEEDFFSILNGA